LHRQHGVHGKVCRLHITWPNGYVETTTKIFTLIVKFEIFNYLFCVRRRLFVYPFPFINFNLLLINMLLCTDFGSSIGGGHGSSRVVELDEPGMSSVSPTRSGTVLTNSLRKSNRPSDKMHCFLQK
jgi:hypothetical protein